MGRDPPVRGREARLPAGPDRQPRRARTSRTRSTTTRGCGCAAPRSRSVDGWSWRSRSSTTSEPWPPPEAREDSRAFALVLATVLGGSFVGDGSVEAACSISTALRLGSSGDQCSACRARSTPRATTPVRSTVDSAGDLRCRGPLRPRGWSSMESSAARPGRRWASGVRVRPAAARERRESRRRQELRAARSVRRCAVGSGSGNHG